jgi:hypothetical protein
MIELYEFVVADYFATGEGRTVCMLVTRAYPKSSDYVKESHFDEYGKWHYEPETRNTPAERARREFEDLFGAYMTTGAEVVDRKTFLSRFDNMIPPALKHMLAHADQPGNMSFSQEFHVNFS